MFKIVLQKCDSIGSVAIGIPNGVTEISDGVFENFKNLKILILPDSLVHIGNHAFRGCTALEHIEIPNSVISIGEGAFEDCELLYEVILPTDLNCISASTFKNCRSLKRITIPKRVRFIGEYAFYNCENLDCVIPKKIKVGYYAFGGCKKMSNSNGLDIGGSYNE